MPDNVSGKLIANLPEATAAEDTDIMILENATKTQKITWGTILNLIKAKLGIGTAANLQTTSKEIVGAVNELNSNAIKIAFIVKKATTVASTNALGGYTVNLGKTNELTADIIDGTVLALIPLGAVASSDSNHRGVITCDGYGSSWVTYYICEPSAREYKASFVCLYK